MFKGDSSKGPNDDRIIHGGGERSFSQGILITAVVVSIVATLGIVLAIALTIAFVVR